MAEREGPTRAAAHATEARPRAGDSSNQYRAVAGVSVEGRGRDLFGAAERLDLEGIVAKRAKDSYAPTTVCYKVKNRAYTQMEGRGELFYPRRPE